MARDDDRPGPLGRLRRGLQRGLALLFGRPSWEAPPWGRALARGFRQGAASARNNRSQAVALVGSMLLVVVWSADTFCIMDRGRTVAEGKMPDLNDELVRKHLVV